MLKIISLSHQFTFLIDKLKINQDATCNDDYTYIAIKLT